MQRRLTMQDQLGQIAGQSSACGSWRLVPVRGDLWSNPKVLWEGSTRKTERRHPVTPLAKNTILTKNSMVLRRTFLGQVTLTETQDQERIVPSCLSVTESRARSWNHEAESRATPDNHICIYPSL